MIITIIVLIVAILLMIIFAIPLMLVETLFWLIIIGIGLCIYGLLKLIAKPFRKKEKDWYY